MKYGILAENTMISADLKTTDFIDIFRLHNLLKLNKLYLTKTGSFLNPC